MVGNKLDLSENRKVSFEEASNFAQQYKMPYIETSAKDSQNINELFELTVSNFLEKNHFLKNQKNIKLNNENKENDGCCK